MGRHKGRSVVEYKGIYIDRNPWKYGEGEYQDLLGVDNEPEFIVYAPDVEFYCETIENAKRGIDRWIEKNGDVETYRFHADMKLGWNRLEVL
jgi:hypothetical protein